MGARPTQRRVSSSLINRVGTRRSGLAARVKLLGDSSTRDTPPSPLLAARIAGRMNRIRAKEGDVYCPECGLHQPATHRYCIACGTWLPLELTEEAPKVTQMFLGIPTHPSDPPAPVLRASHYLQDIEIPRLKGRFTCLDTTFGSRSGRMIARSVR